jgi:hypothetical protein
MNGLTIWMAALALLLAGAGCALGGVLWRWETAKDKGDLRLRGLEDRMRRIEQKQTQLTGRLHEGETRQGGWAGEGQLPGRFSGEVEKLLCYQAKGRRAREKIGE